MHDFECPGLLETIKTGIPWFAGLGARPLINLVGHQYLPQFTLLLSMRS